MQKPSVQRNHNFKSLIACGSSGNLMSLICCGMFMFLTAEMALVGPADKPAWKSAKVF